MFSILFSAYFCGGALIIVTLSVVFNQYSAFANCPVEQGWGNPKHSEECGISTFKTAARIKGGEYAKIGLT